jgi:hypothetical protein
MYYLELIQRFWDFNQKNQIGATGISMYLFLLKTGYDNNRYDFHISDVAMSKTLGLTRKTIKSTKEKLAKFGLIEFKSQNGIPGYYRLMLNYPLQIAEPIKVAQANIEKNAVFPRTQNVEILTSIQQLVPKVDHKKIPSYEEFIEYAKTLKTYDTELELRVKEKYEDWLRKGWRNNSNRPLTNWKSSIKSILPYMKNRDHEHQLSVSVIPSIERPKI